MFSIFPHIVSIRYWFVLLVLLSGFILCLHGESYADKPISRKILAIYNNENGDGGRFSPTHRYLEMPANHLGFDINYHDVSKPFPKLGDEYRAIVVWLDDGNSVKNPDDWLDWLEDNVKNGKKLVIIENLGVGEKYRKSVDGMARVNRLLLHLGIKDTNLWNSLTYTSSVVYKNPQMIGFERELPASLPPYMNMIAIPGRSVSHLRVQSEENSESSGDLVITSKNGGYISAGYTLFEGYPILSVKEDKNKLKRAFERKDSEKGKKDKLSPSKVGKAGIEGPVQTARRSNDNQAIQAMQNMLGKTKHKKYVKKREVEDNIVQQWYINPFLFLRSALESDDEPKPDVTTLNGKRIFYSHIDGDGWNNVSEIAKYRRKKIISSEVVRREILLEYPDLPTTVSAVTSEIDPVCYGLASSAKVARDIFMIDSVEPASHTHSHPLLWGYFEDGNQDKEIPFLKKYPHKPSHNDGLYSSMFTQEKPSPMWAKYYKNNPEKEALMNGKGEFENETYHTPRSYACEPYSVVQEVKGSIDMINNLAPENKKARIILWSGNTSPYEEVLREIRERGFLNMNGGDSRFDNEYPSYSSVSSVGFRVGNEQQIYSSNSNENTYTNLWTDRFYGFRYLKATVENTEKPLRILPFNIYYHMYSGEKQASLNAVKENLDFARTQNIIPIEASNFAELAGGFYTTDLQLIAKNRWKIVNRGKLNTIRFDNSTLRYVDVDNSKGVLGFNYFQGKIYVSLDPSFYEPEIQIKTLRRFGYLPSLKRAYMVDSSWKIKDLLFVNDMLIFVASGYGNGKMSWKFPRKMLVELEVVNKDKIVESKVLETDSQGLLKLDLKPIGRSLVEVKLKQKNN